jgi:hypothetical protein
MGGWDAMTSQVKPRREMICPQVCNQYGYKPRFVPWNPWERVLNRDGFVPRTHGK